MTLMDRMDNWLASPLVEMTIEQFILVQLTIWGFLILWRRYTSNN